MDPSDRWVWTTADRLSGPGVDHRLRCGGGVELCPSGGGGGVGIRPPGSGALGGSGVWHARRCRVRVAAARVRATRTRAQDIRPDRLTIVLRPLSGADRLVTQPPRRGEELGTL